MEITIDERSGVIPCSADPLRVPCADRHGIRFPILSRRPSGDTGVKENLIPLRKKKKTIVSGILSNWDERAVSLKKEKKRQRTYEVRSGGVARCDETKRKMEIMENLLENKQKE